MSGIARTPLAAQQDGARAVQRVRVRLAWLSAAHEVSQPGPLRLAQNTASPLTGNARAPRRGNAVAPPAGTSLAYSMNVASRSPFCVSASTRAAPAPTSRSSGRSAARSGPRCRLRRYTRRGSIQFDICSCSADSTLTAVHCSMRRLMVAIRGAASSAIHATELRRESRREMIR